MLAIWVHGMAVKDTERAGGGAVFSVLMSGSNGYGNKTTVFYVLNISPLLVLIYSDKL